MASRADLNLEDTKMAQAWITAFKAKARAKKWIDNDEEKAITDNFISNCGLMAINTISAIVSPKKIDELAFEEICQAIEIFLMPKSRLVVAERTNFYGIKQEADEKITKYVARLREGARYCQFEKLRESKSPEEEMIVIGLLAGMWDRNQKTKVLEKAAVENLTVSQITEVIQQLDQVKTFISDEKNQELESGMHHVASNKHNREKISRDNNIKGRMMRCFKCDKVGHIAKECRSSCDRGRVECYKCHKKGHFANECHFNEDITKQNEDVRENHNIADVFSVCGMVMSASMVTIKMIISEKKSISMLMQEDTGSSATMISTTMWIKAGKPELKPYRGPALRSYDGSVLKIVGVLEGVIEYNKRFELMSIIVVLSDKTFGLIGRDQLAVNTVHSITLEEKDERLGAIRNIKASLQVKENTCPIFHNARTIPLPLQEEANKEIKRMEKMGIITEIEAGGSEWASPVVISRKPNGGIRLCCDYKTTINQYLLDDHYRVPDMETVFSKLADAKIFAKFDLQSAYWQIELDDQSKKLTTINTNTGLYQFNRLPFGVKTASAIFQRTIEKICSGLEGVTVYQDDILVHARNEEELKQRSGKLLQRLSKRNVTINWMKSIRNAKTVTFLGHVISEEGIKPDPRLVEKISRILPPKTKKEVECFIGLINFYGTKIKEFAAKCEPINKLRKNGCPFIWGKEQQNAFDKIKEELKSNVIVKPYSLNKEVTVTCDASDTAIASIISQEGHPVMYLSRLLSKAERNYAVIEREALAIIWSIKRAEKLLLGRKFKIKTDHRALEYVFGEHKEIPQRTSARVQRWAIFLMGYDYQIEHIHGEKIPHVDALSRLHFQESLVNEVEELQDGIHWNDECGIEWRQLQRESMVDKLTMELKRRIRDDNWSQCTPVENQYKKNATALSVVDGILILGTRPVVPRMIRSKVIETAHRSHFGMSTTKLLLKRNVWWPGMDRDVENYIRNCSGCAMKPKANIESQLHRWDRVKEPFERIHIDWAYVPSIGNILIIVDAMTGWVEAMRCQDRSSEAVMQILRAIFARFGVPVSIVTDNAKEFISEEVMTWIHKIGARAIQCPQYHPQSNGLAERMVQTIKRAIKIWSIEKGDFHGFLQKILLTYRSSRIVGNRNGTPAKLMFGREIRHPLIAYSSPNLIYTAKPGKTPEKCLFLFQNSERTVYIECGGKSRLAHIDQLRVDPSQIESTNEEANIESRAVNQLNPRREESINFTPEESGRDAEEIPKMKNETTKERDCEVIQEEGETSMNKGDENIEIPAGDDENRWKTVRRNPERSRHVPSRYKT